MHMVSSIWALCALLSFCLAFSPNYEYEWVQMKYDWDHIGQDENQWINEGLYIPENCVLAGIKQWKDSVFVTIPRWAPGVPATLNKVVVKNGNPLLQPFPPIEQQMINTTKGLKNVQSKF